MSYSISIYRKEVKEAEQQFEGEDFFGNENNLLSFTEEQYQQLKERLLRYNYKISREYGKQITLENSEEKTSALLTGRGLYFNASGEGIFEISMTSSEFTDNGSFVKYDPQNGGWED